MKETTLVTAQDDLSGIHVALYESYSKYDSRVNNSRTALYHMFQWMNASVRIVNTSDILYGALWAHEILCIPEGLGPFIEDALGAEGMQIIRDWVAAGGSYIGSRGSMAMAVPNSYFEGSWTEFELNLVNGTTYGMPELGHTLMTNVNINQSCVGPNLSDIPSSYSVLFQTGRYFVPAEGEEVHVIARYQFNGQIAMLGTHYGQGTVFLSSPLFEYEEDSDRDGTSLKDRYDDPDSEWPLVLRVVQWLLADSPTVRNATTWEYPIETPTETTTPTANTTGQPVLPTELIIAVSGVGVVVLLVVVVFARKR
jgi:glutamine amidotransferase-like uncharacterized protein